MAQNERGGLALNELRGLVRNTQPRTRTVSWYRKMVVELAVITATVISIGLYLIAVVAFARWAL